MTERPHRPPSRRPGRAAASILLTAALVPGVSSAGGAEEPRITTIAGGAIQDAAAAGVTIRPAGVDADDAGNLYVSDPGNDLLWRISPEGRASVIAGDARPCLVLLTQPAGPECRREGAGDGGPAIDAHLVSPGSVAVGPDGDVFLAEPDAHDIRIIDAGTGRISTAVGTGETGYDPEQEGQPGRAVSINNPQSLATDSAGALYFVDPPHALVRRLDPDGTVSTFLGCAGACPHPLRHGAPISGSYLTGLQTVAVGPDDRVYIGTPTAIYLADLVAGQYRRVAGDTFTAGTQPGQGEGGPAENARFKDISALTFGPGGNLHVLDRGWHRLRTIAAPVGPGSVVTHAAGGGAAGFTGDGGPATQALFSVGETRTPAGVAVLSGGDLVIGDLNNGRLRHVDVATGIVTTIAGSGITAPATRIHHPKDLQPTQSGVGIRGGYSGDGGPAARAQLWGPADVAADAAGNVYVADAYSHRIRRIAADGTISTVAGSGCAGKGCNQATTPLGDGGPATSASLYHPVAVALSADGTQLYIADQAHFRIRQVNLGTAPVTVYGSPLPTGAPITIQPGHIATVFGSGQRCQNILPACGDGGFATSATVGYLGGLAAHGNAIYFSDSDGQQVRMIDRTTGMVRPVMGIPFWSDCNGQGVAGSPGAATLLCGPTDLAVSPSGGTLYVAETGTYGFGSGIVSDEEAPRVRAVSLTDPFPSTVVAGTGDVGLSGDGGPAHEARLGVVGDVALGPDGSLYIADTGNSRIRRVAPGGTISTVAGVGALDGTVEMLGGFNATGLAGCSHTGDGGPASAAALCAPLGVAFAGGTLYIADQMNNRIRAVTGL